MRIDDTAPVEGKHASESDFSEPPKGAPDIPSLRFPSVKMSRIVTVAIFSALLIELVGHSIDQFWHPPFVYNVLTLLAVLTLNVPAALLVIWVPQRPVVRNILFLAGIGLVLTVVLDMTKDIHALEDWMLIGNHSALRGHLRWFTLVGSIFLLFGGIYYAVGDLVDSRASLQAKHRDMVEEMRQRKLAESAAQAARDYAENLIRTANVIVIGLDADRKLTVFNKAAERITGYTRSELEELGWFDTLMPPSHYPGLRDRLVDTTTGGIPRHLEGPIRTKSGEDRQIAWSNSEVVEAGRVTGTISFGLDITERKHAEAELLRSSKLATLGVVTAGLAHEIGNPLASLSTRLNLMQENDDPAFLRESIDVLQRQISRISRIVYSVSRFSRPMRMEAAECDVNAAVIEALDVVRFHQCAKRCKIGMDLAKSLPKVRAVHDQLAQVFLNLGLNALEAMPQGGTLTVTTRLAGTTAEIEFRDTGTGLTEEAKNKMFEAFYTSKEHGMGLGLNIAHSIITDHKGRIVFENNPDGGARFIVILPITALPAGAAEDAAGERA
jgi:PAS domain S-box-containing protein